MTKYSLPYFGEIDLTALDEYYDVNIDLNGNTVNIDLNFEKESSDWDKFDTVKSFLNNINNFDQQNKSYIEDDFQKEGNASARAAQEIIGFLQSNV